MSDTIKAYADYISKQVGDISERISFGNSPTPKKPKQEPHTNIPVTKSPKKDSGSVDHDLSTKTQTHTAPTNKTPSKTPMREPTKFPPGSKVTPSFSAKGNRDNRKIYVSKNEAIEFSQEEIDAFAAIVNEAAKKGTERVSYHGGIIHKVLHSDKKTGDHLTMSYSEEPGSVYFHGRMNGKKIRVDSASDLGDQPTHQDFARDLKKAHPDLPKETHEKIGKIAKKGLKELEYGED